MIYLYDSNKRIQYLIKKEKIMKYVKKQDSDKFYGCISTQVSNSDPDIKVGKKELMDIANGDFTFTIDAVEKHSFYDRYDGIKEVVRIDKKSIGILEINGQAIHCLEREFNKNWPNIIKKIGKQFEFSNADIDEMLSKQPKPCVIIKERKVYKNH